MTLTIERVLELKKQVRDKFMVELHFHDCCGGQYFTLDSCTPELKAFIEVFFEKISLHASFTDDCLMFSVKK